MIKRFVVTLYLGIAIVLGCAQLANANAYRQLTGIPIHNDLVAYSLMQYAGRISPGTLGLFSIPDSITTQPRTQGESLNSYCQQMIEEGYLLPPACSSIP